MGELGALNASQTQLQMLSPAVLFSTMDTLRCAVLGCWAANPEVRREMSRAVTGCQVVGKEQAILPRPIMNVALTYDHRLIDGREGVTFLKRVKEIVEDPRRLLLDV